MNSANFFNTLDLGTGRSYDRSASWFDREDPSANGGSVSPRKIYSRAPFEDWRKPAGGAAVGGGGSGTGAPTGEVEDGMDVGSGWRGSGPSGRRWNAPSSASGNWRSEQGDQGAGPYRGGPPPPRGDGSGGAYVNGNSRWRDEEGPYRGGRGRATTAFGRQRSRNDGHDLPEWAMDDDDDRAGGAGGTFDASGKFRAPSSESPPPTASSKAGSAPPQESREANGKSDRNAVSTIKIQICVAECKRSVVQKGTKIHNQEGFFRGTSQFEKDYTISIITLKLARKIWHEF